MTKLKYAWRLSLHRPILATDWMATWSWVRGKCLTMLSVTTAVIESSSSVSPSWIKSLRVQKIHLDSSKGKNEPFWCQKKGCFLNIKYIWVLIIHEVGIISNSKLRLKSSTLQGWLMIVDINQTFDLIIDHLSKIKPLFVWQKILMVTLIP